MLFSQLALSLASMLTFGLLTLSSHALEISRDTKYYVGPEELDILLRYDGQLYNANDLEFYFTNGTREVVLLNVTSGEEFFALDVPTGDEADKYILNVLNNAIAGKILKITGQIALLSTAEYLVWTTKKDTVIGFFF